VIYESTSCRELYIGNKEKEKESERERGGKRERESDKFYL